MPEHFGGISFPSVVRQFPAATEEQQHLRYQLANSFINNCSDINYGIMAAASELNHIYTHFIPDALKQKDRYAPGQGFQRACRYQPSDNAYPLHTGWLMAVAAYNAGPRAVDAVAYYQQWDKVAVEDPVTWDNFHADKLIESLYWAGRYNPQNDLIEFRGLNGEERNWQWFKGCVVQRHVARIVQHVT